MMKGRVGSCEGGGGFAEGAAGRRVSKQSRALLPATSPERVTHHHSLAPTAPAESYSSLYSRHPRRSAQPWTTLSTLLLPCCLVWTQRWSSTAHPS